MAAHPIYHMVVEAERCVARMRVNGFPVYEIRATTWREVTPPLNPVLVGADNLVEVEIDSVSLAGGRPSVFRDVMVKGTVERFDKGSVVQPNGGQVALEIAIPEPLVKAAERGEEVPLPFIIEGRFDNQGPAFRQPLLEGPSYHDESALVDYAMHLRELVIRRDVGGIEREWQPKVQAYAIAYDVDGERLRGQFLDGITDDLLSNELEDFRREDVVLAPFCNGRIWELKRTGDLPLLRNKAHKPDDAVMSLRVMVAPVDGDLKVVR